jgi:hypothetical protein
MLSFAGGGGGHWLAEPEMIRESEPKRGTPVIDKPYTAGLKNKKF